MRMRSRARLLVLFALLTTAATRLLPKSESHSLAGRDVPVAAAAATVAVAAAAAVDDGQDGKPHHDSLVDIIEDGRGSAPSSSLSKPPSKSLSKAKLQLNRLAVNSNGFPKTPIAPKVVPPTPPHAEQEMLQAAADAGDKKSVGVGIGIGGLGSPSGANIAAITASLANPDHLAVVPKKTATAAEPSNPEHPAGPYKPDLSDYDPDRLIQPLHSFLLSFTMILFSEVGDKTFLVAALMAMKHDRIVVFTAAGSALLVMTVLSAVLGHTVPLLVPKRITSLAASGLFFVFGANLLREGLAMSPGEGITAEMHEVENEIAEKESVQSAAAREMGVPFRAADPSARPSRSPSRFPAAGRRSPSPISPREDRASVGQAAGGALQGMTNLLSFLLSPAWVQTFVMTFLAEWGDRSQIATIAMAAGQDYWWVTSGAMCGHAICTGAAVLGGRAVAGRVSLKVVTIGGASAFILFGFIYLVESVYS